MHPINTSYDSNSGSSSCRSSRCIKQQLLRCQLLLLGVVLLALPLCTSKPVAAKSQPLGQYNADQLADISSEYKADSLHHNRNIQYSQLSPHVNIPEHDVLTDQSLTSGDVTDNRESRDRNNVTDGLYLQSNGVVENDFRVTSENDHSQSSRSSKSLLSALKDSTVSNTGVVELDENLRVNQGRHAVDNTVPRLGEEGVESGGVRVRRNRRSAIWWLGTAMRMCETHRRACKGIQVDDGAIRLQIQLVDQ